MGFDTLACYKCGDSTRDVVNAEVCDNADLDNKTCVDQGFTAGTLRCKKDCKAFDTTDCYKCGDNIRHRAEACDGTDVAGLTCVSGGYTGGTITCKKDCSGIDFSGCFGWDWVVREGDAYADDVVNGVALDTKGNTYITGYIEPTGVAAPAELNGFGAYDVFVASLDSDGAFSWINGGNSTGFITAAAIAADSTSNSYITGIYTGTATLGTLPSLSASHNIFVAKLDPDGQFLYAAGAVFVSKAGANNANIGTGVAADDKGNAHYVGHFERSGIFGSKPLKSKGDVDTYVFRLGSPTHFFTPLSAPTYRDLETVWGTSATNVWAAGGNALVHYNGSKWSLKDPSSGKAKGKIFLKGIWGSSATDVFVAGYYYLAPSSPTKKGMIYHYDGKAFVVGAKGTILVQR